MYDREDYEDLKKKKKNGHDQTWNLEYFVQAQVVMENLTGNQYWDRFLSYLQGSRDRLEDVKKDMEGALCNPLMVDQNEIMATKTALARVGGMLEMLEGVLALPNDIIKTGGDARKRLAEIEQSVSGGD